MGEKTAPQQPPMKVGETRLFAVSFDHVLDKPDRSDQSTWELLTGTPTVAELTTSDLSITNKAVSTSALTIQNKSVIIGRAVQFLVSGQLVANAPYTISISCGTDSTPAQTMKGDVVVPVEA